MASLLGTNAATYRQKSRKKDSVEENINTNTVSRCMLSWHTLVPMDEPITMQRFLQLLWHITLDWRRTDGAFSINALSWHETQNKKRGLGLLTWNGGDNGEAVQCIKYHMRSSCRELWNAEAGKTGGAETSKRESREAHLTIAIRWQDYSIALTKYFENIVKLRERKAEKKGG